jgi:hypothetical protein
LNDQLASLPLIYCLKYNIGVLVIVKLAIPTVLTDIFFALARSAHFAFLAVRINGHRYGKTNGTGTKNSCLASE